jgi:hypothetical protein
MAAKERKERRGINFHFTTRKMNVAAFGRKPDSLISKSLRRSAETPLRKIANRKACAEICRAKDAKKICSLSSC